MHNPLDQVRCLDLSKADVPSDKEKLREIRDIPLDFPPKHMNDVFCIGDPSILSKHVHLDFSEDLYFIGKAFYIMQGLTTELKTIGEKRAYALLGKRNMIHIPPLAAHVVIVEKNTSIIGFYDKHTNRGKTLPYEFDNIPLILIRQILDNPLKINKKSIEKACGAKLIYPNENKASRIKKV